jgi:hypothetical protein
MAGRHNTSTDAPDPRESAYWDLNETLAWIVHRSERAVLEARGRWRAVTAQPPPHSREEDRTKRRRARAWNFPTARGQEKSHGRERGSRLPIIFSAKSDKAFKQLKAHLEAGDIRADGRRELFDERQPIPPLQWADLSCSIMSANPPADALVVIFVDADERYGVAAPKPAWRDVRFQVADIIKMFPPKAARTSAPSSPVSPEPEPLAAAPRPKPEFPNNLVGRVARELWERHRGRWGKVEVMRADLAGESRLSFSPRTFDDALAFLAEADSETWPRQRHSHAHLRNGCVKSA